jgi:hypothetical protein
MSLPSRLRIVFFALAALFTVALGRAEDALPVPECTKEDARKIFLAQEWTDVNVIAVINGVNKEKIASPSLCHVLGMARRDGSWHELKSDLYFDRDLGWFAYESGAELFRIWTRDGYREIKPRFGF